MATAATQTQLTWIVDSYTLVLACLLLPAGAIGDRHGRRSALLVGLALFAVASFIPLAFGAPVQIIAARALAGAGAAFVMPATLSLLTAVFPPEDRTKAVGAGSSFLVMAIVVGVAALIIPLYAPGRDGAQLLVVRRLRARLTTSESHQKSIDLDPSKKAD